LLKPLPIVLMIFHLYRSGSGRKHLILINTGLAICLVGDVLLMSKEMSYFNIGTCFFMVGHTFYIFGFRIGRVTRSLGEKYVVLRKYAFAILLFLVFVNVFTLWDKLPYKLLYGLYALILGIEAMVTLARYETTSEQSFNSILYGVLLFAISDNILGFLKFNHIRTDVGRCVIMLTYYGAQFFIMKGAIAHHRLEEEGEGVRGERMKVK
jgi:uncharacterized membrane protein YhhN